MTRLQLCFMPRIAARHIHHPPGAQWGWEQATPDPGHKGSVDHRAEGLAADKHAPPVGRERERMKEIAILGAYGRIYLYTHFHAYIRGEGKRIKDNSGVKFKRSSGQEKLATSNKRDICRHRFNILFYSFLESIDYPKSYHCHIFKRSRDDIHHSFLLSKTDEHCCILHTTSFGKKKIIFLK